MRNRWLGWRRAEQSSSQQRREGKRRDGGIRGLYCTPQRKKGPPWRDRRRVTEVTRNHGDDEPQEIRYLSPVTQKCLSGSEVSMAHVSLLCEKGSVFIILGSPHSPQGRPLSDLLQSAAKIASSNDLHRNCPRQHFSSRPALSSSLPPLFLLFPSSCNWFTDSVEASKTSLSLSNAGFHQPRFSPSWLTFA